MIILVWINAIVFLACILLQSYFWLTNILPSTLAAVLLVVLMIVSLLNYHWFSDQLDKKKGICDEQGKR